MVYTLRTPKAKKKLFAPKVKMTRSGHDRLKQELEHRLQTLRPKLAKKR